jgi:hypothetical protein
MLSSLPGRCPTTDDGDVGKEWGNGTAYCQKIWRSLNGIRAHYVYSEIRMTSCRPAVPNLFDSRSPRNLCCRPLIWCVMQKSLTFMEIYTTSGTMVDTVGEASIRLQYPVRHSAGCGCEGGALGHTRNNIRLNEMLFFRRCQSVYSYLWNVHVFGRFHERDAKSYRYHLRVCPSIRTSTLTNSTPIGWIFVKCPVGNFH